MRRGGAAVRVIPVVGLILGVVFAGSVWAWASEPGGSATPSDGAARKADGSRSGRLELRDGDRVAFIGATLLERDRHVGYFESVLRTRYPGLRLSFRNMAWPGDTTTVQLRPLNFGSLEEHIGRQKPTVAIVSYGANEAFEGPAGLDAFLEGYRKILDILEKSCREIVIVSPNRHEDLGPPLPDPGPHNANLEIYTAAIEKLAEERGYLFVDLFHGLDSGSGNRTEPALTENGIHLNEYGYWRGATLIVDAIGPAATDWSVAIAANTGKVSRGEVRDVSASTKGVRFTATASRVIVPPPEEETAEAHLTGPLPVLRVTGLEAGRYALAIDGHDVVTASAAEWSRGVTLADSPDRAQGSALRREVIWKNLLFFNRWRAHNGEYIYGRRSTTSEGWSRNKDGGNSGNPSFPGEMAELDRLVEESDAKADELAKPREHVYELRRVN